MSITCLLFEIYFHLLSTTIMARSNKIRILNPFNMQHGSNVQIHLYIQEVVNYAESRFGAVLPVIGNAVLTVEIRRLLQARLKEELVIKV